MDEEGVARERAEFSDCWKVTWETPYITRLSFSAGIGGLLFGYNTGVISGALLYIKEDFEEVAKSTIIQEIIVSVCVAGAIIGAALGGYFNDRFGRKRAILGADIAFFVGSLVMAFAHAPATIILGRLIVGMGVGSASMSSPLYISETSPASIRGALVSTNAFLVTGSQFLSYIINLGFTRVSGTWRWMLGVAALPALIQFLMMLSLPESPRWLFRQNKVKEARDVLERIYPAEEVEQEIRAMIESVEKEMEMEASIGKTVVSKINRALGDKVVRRGLYAGVTVQVAQQFAGINTVMYYAPTILQHAGFASNSVALALSLVTSGLNAVGSIISMLFVDKYGRRRLMMISMIGIIFHLVVLAVVFQVAFAHSPNVSLEESQSFGANATCPTFLRKMKTSKLDCMACSKAKCSFCANGANPYSAGACLVSTKDLRNQCRGGGRIWFEEGCPSRTGFQFLAVILLGLYIISYSPGMGTVPWIINSEIYPLRYRGVGGGIAAVANWTSNLIVSLTFLSIIDAFTAARAFIFYAGVSIVGLVAICILVPETKGLQFEEVEKMLMNGIKASNTAEVAKKSKSAVVLI